MIGAFTLTPRSRVLKFSSGRKPSVTVEFGARQSKCLISFAIISCLLLPEAGCSAEKSKAAAQAQHLALDEIVAVDLPPTLMPISAVLDSLGNATLLGHGGRIATVTTAGVSKLIAAPSNAGIVGAMKLASGIISTVDSTGRTGSVDAGGRYQINRDFRPGIAIDQAVPFQAGWILGGYQSTEIYVFKLISDANGVQTLANLRIPLDHFSPNLRRPIASASGTSVTLARPTFPYFRALLVIARSTIDGSTLIPFNGIEASPLDSLHQMSWRAMRLLGLDGAFVQTASDVKSDRRELILSDSAGRTIRRSALDLPIGFLASSVPAHELIALRGLNGNELVFYKWRWSSTR